MNGRRNPDGVPPSRGLTYAGQRSANEIGCNIPSGQPSIWDSIRDPNRPLTQPRQRILDPIREIIELQLACATGLNLQEESLLGTAY